MVEVIEMSDIECGQGCKCGGSVKVLFNQPTKDSEGETTSWAGYCIKCGKQFVVLND